MKLAKLLAILFISLSFLILTVIFGVAIIVYHYSHDLPDYTQLSKYDPPTITRLYAANGRMLAEYAEEKRLYIPIDAIPKRVIHAFISAEDKNFYVNSGVDFMSIFRAAINNAANYGSRHGLSGGSTITQQVVKNFLLSNERSIKRKVREAILSFRITKAFSKDRILELYLNQIYLGNHSYGVAAAALNYFNKSIGELTVEEAAMLAALPKAPSSIDPWHYYDRALERRNWVIDRMEEEGYITDSQAKIAQKTPIKLATMPKIELVNPEFFTDSVKQQLINKYGEAAVTRQGFAVHTTLDPVLQKYAEDALLAGVVEYDHRHGWRGPIKHIDISATKDWQEKFFTLPTPANIGIWKLAIVTKITNNNAKILLRDKTQGDIALKNMSWARKFIRRNSIGSPVKKVSDVLKIGDVIAVSKVGNSGNSFALEQIPQINGAIVALDPQNGNVKAMVGGYYYGGSQFNRATQALRQPGSSFKPFVYLTALENGFAPNSIINDQEMHLSQGNNQLWVPKNHTGEYYGPTPLRVGVEQSLNAMTVRLSQLVGIDKVSETTKRFGISDNPPRNLAMVLGAAETTLLRMVTGYAMILNGGKQIYPTLIERIQDRKGHTIYRSDNRDCIKCNYLGADFSKIDIEELNKPPVISDARKSIADEIAAYQTVSILEGVVQRGTAHKAVSLNHTIAGKTGTTNDSFDAWFIGFTPNLVVGVFTGFDEPASLGKHEYGATVSLPIWINFMEKALANQPDIPFRKPNGIKLVKIDIKTGNPPTPDSQAKNIIFEAFRAGTPTNARSAESISYSTNNSNSSESLKEKEDNQELPYNKDNLSNSLQIPSENNTNSPSSNDTDGIY